MHMNTMLGVLLAHIKIWAVLLCFFVLWNSTFATTPPVITSPMTASIQENTTSVMMVTATDNDLPAQNLNFFISQIFWFWWADDMLFSIDQTTGELSFITPPDYENPMQAWSIPNEYEVEVWVDDGTGNDDVMTIIVTVTDVVETINIISPLDGDFINTNSVTITWTWAPLMDYVVDDGFWSQYATWTTDANGDYSIVISWLVEGINDIEVYPAGWSFTDWEFIEVEVDTVAPNQPVLTLPTNFDSLYWEHDIDFWDLIVTVKDNTGVVIWMWLSVAWSFSNFELTNFSSIPLVWDVTVTLTDQAWNESMPAIISTSDIDHIQPTLYFSDDVEIWPVTQEIFTLVGSDNNSFTNNQWSTIINFYTVISSNVCNATTFNSSMHWSSSYNSWQSIMFTWLPLSSSSWWTNVDSDFNNGMYICAKFTDAAWNTTYIWSANPLNIDTSVSATILSHQDNDIINSNSIILTWTGTVWETLMVWDWNGAIYWTTWIVDSNWDFSITMIWLQEWLNIFEIFPSSSFNVNDWDSVDIIVDTTVPVITLTGNATITHTEWVTYTDAWATFSDNIDGTWSVVWVSTVDINAVWSYTVSYDYTDTAWNSATQVVRTVNVVAAPDTTDPVITLTGNATITHTEWVAYIDAWATFSDNVDGTWSVVWVSTVDINTVWSYTVSYDYTDTAWNVATQVTRTVNVVAAPPVVDTTAPVITLIGNTTITHTQWVAYIDAWATFSDNVDGTWSVVWVWTVDINTIWSYTVSYDYTDAAWNVATQVVRTVNVVAAPVGPDTIAPIIWSVTAQGLVEALLIAWNTNEDAVWSVEYWLTAALWQIEDSNSSLLQSHSYQIPWLTACTEYFYKVTSVDVSGNSSSSPVWSFTTSCEQTVTPSTSSWWGWGGWGWGSSRLCKAETHLECKQNVSGEYVYFKKSWKSCRRGDLWKPCSIESEEEIVKEVEEVVINAPEPIVEETVIVEEVITPQKENTPEERESKKLAKLFNEQFSEESQTQRSSNGMIEKKRAINGSEKVYMLTDDYTTCEVIDNILLEDYAQGYTSSLADISTLSDQALILNLEKQGIISGTKENNFEWGRSISRVEFLKLVLRTHCIDYSSVDPSWLSFGDLDNSSWQAKVVKKAVDLGIASWDLDVQWRQIFRADDVITYIEASKILLRMWLVQNGTSFKSSYTDVSELWQQKYVAQWEELWIFSPSEDNNIFNPNSWVTREKSLTAIYKVLRLYR